MGILLPLLALTLLSTGITDGQKKGQQLTFGQSMSPFMIPFKIPQIPQISGVSPTHNGRVCSTWGNYHFKTFDGDVIQVPSTCNFVLSSLCKSDYEDFNVQMRRHVVDGLPTIGKITMKLDGTVVELVKDSILVNHNEVKLPYSQLGVLIETTSSHIKITSKLGLVATWNKDDSFLMEMDKKYRNQTCGLCGDFNGVQTYDEFFKDGAKLSAINLANVWRMDSPTEDCEEPAPLPPKSCKTDKMKEACEKLMSKEAFSSCQDLVPSDYLMQACVSDKCNCDEESSCLCNTISEYSRQCVHAGGQPQQWRTEEFCGKSCPNNMEYQECGTPCIDTCSNSDRSQLCDEHCTDGCFCPAGTVYDDITEAGCIKVEECPCTYNGKAYGFGESYETKCRKCTCSGGDWICKELECPGTCSVEGGSHITTFDGKAYSINGQCSFYLVKPCKGNDFAILGDLEKCGLTSTESCLKAVIIRLSDTTISINPNGGVSINNLAAPLPLATDMFAIFKPSTFYIIVETIHGVQLRIQLVPVMQVYITLIPSHKGKTCGLCGNFNNMQTDDFKSNTGLIESTAPAFANTWKTRNSCPDITGGHENPCSLSVENEQYAQYWCSFLTEANGPFSVCHSEISPDSYHAKCMHDSCNCEKSEDCMCAALSSYVHACAVKGITIKGWRDPACKKYMECPSSMVFQEGVTSCKRTCRSLSEPDHTCKVDFIPVDGCVCEEGTYLNGENQCVPRASCPCYYKGVEISPGETIIKNGATCTCKKGSLSCFGTDKPTPTCVKPMVFFDCKKTKSGTKGSECQKTCGSLNMECISTECVSGCVCPAGLVADGKGGCIKEENCPCVHNGVPHQPGSEIKVSCNTCTCKKSKWECSSKDCDGTCAIYGDGNYITFDEKRFRFGGGCEYILTQDYCSKGSNGTFRVITENVPCGTTGTTCSKAIKLYLGGSELILAEGKYEVIQKDTGSAIPFKFRVMGIYLVVEAKNGVILMWDRKTSIFIKLGRKFEGRVCGLCGNFDGNGNNDFTTRSQAVVVSPVEFGNSWKVAPSCPDAKPIKDPCTSNPYRQSWAQKQCSIINSKVFSDCHSQVDPGQYYDSCVSDSCACDSGGDCECFCTAVASYAQACNEAGVCVAWRTPQICPLFCDYYNGPDECEWHYRPCGDSCTKTCTNPSGICSKQIPALEGCYPKCPEDKPYLDEATMKCVPSEQCGCYDEEGNHYTNGQSVPTTKNCETCHCAMTKVSCSYDENACYCIYKGNKYPYGATIYNTTDGDGSCITGVCGKNGTIERHMYPCATTTTVGPTTSTAPFTTALPTTTVFVFSTTEIVLTTEQSETTAVPPTTTEVKPTSQKSPTTTTVELVTPTTPIKTTTSLIIKTSSTTPIPESTSSTTKVVTTPVVPPKTSTSPVVTSSRPPTTTETTSVPPTTTEVKPTTTEKASPTTKKPITPKHETTTTPLMETPTSPIIETSSTTPIPESTSSTTKVVTTPVVPPKTSTSPVVTSSRPPTTTETTSLPPTTTEVKPTTSQKVFTTTKKPSTTEKVVTETITPPTTMGLIISSTTTITEITSSTTKVVTTPVVPPKTSTSPVVTSSRPPTTTETTAVPPTTTEVKPTTTEKASPTTKKPITPKHETTTTPLMETPTSPIIETSSTTPIPESTSSTTKEKITTPIVRSTTSISPVVTSSRPPTSTETTAVPPTTTEVKPTTSQKVFTTTKKPSTTEKIVTETTPPPIKTTTSPIIKTSSTTPIPESTSSTTKVVTTPVVPPKTSTSPVVTSSRPPTTTETTSVPPTTTEVKPTTTEKASPTTKKPITPKHETTTTPLMETPTSPIIETSSTMPISESTSSTTKVVTTPIVPPKTSTSPVVTSSRPPTSTETTAVPPTTTEVKPTTSQKVFTTTKTPSTTEKVVTETTTRPTTMGQIIPSTTTITGSTSSTTKVVTTPVVPPKTSTSPVVTSSRPPTTTETTSVPPTTTEVKPTTTEKASPTTKKPITPKHETTTTPLMETPTSPIIETSSTTPIPESTSSTTKVVTTPVVPPKTSTSPVVTSSRPPTSTETTAVPPTTTEVKPTTSQKVFTTTKKPSTTEKIVTETTMPPIKTTTSPIIKTSSTTPIPESTSSTTKVVTTPVVPPKTSTSPVVTSSRPPTTTETTSVPPTTTEVKPTTTEKASPTTKKPVTPKHETTTTPLMETPTSPIIETSSTMPISESTSSTTKVVTTPIVPPKTSTSPVVTSSRPPTSTVTTAVPPTTTEVKPTTSQKVFTTTKTPSTTEKVVTETTTRPTTMGQIIPSTTTITGSTSSTTKVVVTTPVVPPKTSTSPVVTSSRPPTTTETTAVPPTTTEVKPTTTEKASPTTKKPITPKHETTTTPLMETPTSPIIETSSTMPISESTSSTTKVVTTPIVPPKTSTSPVVTSSRPPTTTETTAVPPTTTEVKPTTSQKVFTTTKKPSTTEKIVTETTTPPIKTTTSPIIKTSSTTPIPESTSSTTKVVTTPVVPPKTSTSPVVTSSRPPTTTETTSVPPTTTEVKPTTTEKASPTTKKPITPKHETTTTPLMETPTSPIIETSSTTPIPESTSSTTKVVTTPVVPPKTSTSPVVTSSRPPTTTETTSVPPTTTEVKPTTTQKASPTTKKPVTTTTILPTSTTPQCSCTYQNVDYPPGSIIYNETDGEGWCFTAYCNAKCEIEKQSKPCPTTVSPPVSTTIEKTTTPASTPSSTSKAVTTPVVRTTRSETSTVVPGCYHLTPPRKPGEKWTSDCQVCECPMDSSTPICKPVECPITPNKTCEKPGQVAVVETVDCCQKTTCVCDVNTCPATSHSCPAGFKPVVTTPKGSCCPEYECKPKPVCVYNETEYKPGAVVPSDKCEDCKCSSTVDPDTKLHSIDCTPVKCNGDCNMGFEYVIVPGECCGECVERDCIIILPDGTKQAIAPGQIWIPPNNKCSKYKCEVIEDQLVPVEVRTVCPEFNPDRCVAGTEKTDADGCCQTCTIRHECKVMKNSTYLEQFGCKTTVPVHISSCKGTCPTSSIYSAMASSMLHSCSCCQETATSKKQVEMICPDGTTFNYTYTDVETCDCTPVVCPEEKSSKKVSRRRR